VNKKIKILTLGDHPLLPSGVGIQTRYMIEAMLKTGKYQFISFGGAIKHQNYDPIKPKEWEGDWVIFPINGYGTQEMVRSVLRNDKPDILWFMTDPRFYGWLWQIENEIRPAVPMVYYHVWDNGPPPTYNKSFYESNDFIATISKVTDNVVKEVAPSVKRRHIPHVVDTDVFKKRPEEDVEEFKEKSSFTTESKKVLFFWNNRNARRKQSGTLIFWFKEFLDIVGHDKASLIMHTEIKDQHGQDLEAIIEHLGLTDGQVVFSMQKYPSETLSYIYNMVDCTINISDAEGFGLATFESLACETPIIVNMTGGLQEQVTDGKDWFGVGVRPSSKAIIGSQDIPWIYEDRLSKEDVVDALLKIYTMSQKERDEMGRKGREHILKNYNYEDIAQMWDETLQYIHDEFGSWDTRKGYQRWTLSEVA